MVFVEVILYKAPEQEFRHWALHFDGPGKKHTVYQVNGAQGSFAFQKKELKNDPNKSKKFHDSVAVSDALDDVKAAEKVMEGVVVDNVTSHWNCQDWVMDALESLKDEDLIPEHDYDQAVEALKEHTGPNDESD
jgi:hypothetical protein